MLTLLVSMCIHFTVVCAASDVTARLSAAAAASAMRRFMRISGRSGWRDYWNARHGSLSGFALTLRQRLAAPQSQTMKRIGIGIIGCGNISGAYLTAARRFPILDVRALADLDMNAARTRSEEFGIPAVEVAALLADPRVEIVVNLTTPPAHVPVGLQALAAGKHVHSEKPLGVTLAEGRQLVQRARELGLRVGSAPDTFLSGAQQTCRKLVDDGAIGRVVAGSAFFMCPGHERWHPNPAFYYGPGAGPMLDMGPYYVTTLVNLLGPVASVAGAVATPRKQRQISSEPRKGQLVDVQVPTHVAGLLTFDSGAVVD